MKKIISSVVIALGMAVAAQAGSTVVTDRTVIASAPYGTGPYIGLQVGANAARFLGSNDWTDNEVGIVAGLKGGYVFGTGFLRPVIEADLFYNGRDAARSGAFLGNFLLKFDFGQFQPYLGGGVGGYTVDTDSGFDESGLAYQVVGGADFYLSQKFSLFAEYKWLNYDDYLGSAETLHQHIFVAGARFHF